MIIPWRKPLRTFINSTSILGLAVDGAEYPRNGGLAGWGGDGDVGGALFSVAVAAGKGGTLTSRSSQQFDGDAEHFRIARQLTIRRDQRQLFQGNGG